MFDFRYHALSLVAVFVALAVGLLLGVAIGDAGLVSSGEQNLREDLRGDVRRRGPRSATPRRERSGPRATTRTRPTRRSSATGSRAGPRIALIGLGGLSSADQPPRADRAGGHGRPGGLPGRGLASRSTSPRCATRSVARATRDSSTTRPGASDFGYRLGTQLAPGRRRCWGGSARAPVLLQRRAGGPRGRRPRSRGDVKLPKDEKAAHRRVREGAGRRAVALQRPGGRGRVDRDRPLADRLVQGARPVERRQHRPAARPDGAGLRARWRQQGHRAYGVKDSRDDLLPPCPAVDPRGSLRCARCRPCPPSLPCRRAAGGPGGCCARWPREGWLRENYRGRSVAFPAGYRRGRGGARRARAAGPRSTSSPTPTSSGPSSAPWSIYALGVALLGLVDDVLERRAPRGLARRTGRRCCERRVLAPAR